MADETKDIQAAPESVDGVSSQSETASPSETSSQSEGRQTVVSAIPVLAESPPPPPDSLAPTSTDGDLSPEIASAAAAARALAERQVAGDVLAAGKPIVEDETPPGIVVDSTHRFPSSRKIAVAEDDADHAFFAGEAAAVAKMHAEEHRQAKIIEVEEKRKERPVVTKEMIERRKKLQKVVSYVVGASAVIALIGLARIALAPKGSAAFEPPPVVVAARPAPAPAPIPEPAKEEPKPAAEENGAATPAVADDKKAEAADDKNADEKKAADATPEKKADEKKADDAVADKKADAKSGEDQAVAANVGSDAAPDPEKAKPLAKKALQLLEMGKNTAAIEQATAAVEADPTDANSYLYWGTALLNMGKIADSKAVFGKCVEKATHGPKNDCRAFK